MQLVAVDSVIDEFFHVIVDIFDPVRWNNHICFYRIEMNDEKHLEYLRINEGITVE